jgi:hypothetical protein
MDQLSTYSGNDSRMWILECSSVVCNELVGEVFDCDGGWFGMDR